MNSVSGGRIGGFAVSLLVTLVILLPFVDSFKSRSLSFRYRIVEPEMAKLFKRSLCFYKTVKEPTYSASRQGSVDSSTFSSDGFIKVDLPVFATGFRLDVCLYGADAVFAGKQKLALEIFVADKRIPATVEFRKDLIGYALGDFKSDDFITESFRGFRFFSCFCLVLIAVFAGVVRVSSGANGKKVSIFVVMGSIVMLIYPFVARESKRTIAEVNASEPLKK